MVMLRLTAISRYSALASNKPSPSFRGHTGTAGRPLQKFRWSGHEADRFLHDERIDPAILCGSLIDKGDELRLLFNVDRVACVGKGCFNSDEHVAQQSFVN